MNINNILKISKFCVMSWLKKNNKFSIVVWSCCSKRLLCGIHCCTISIRDSVSQFSDAARKGKVQHTYKELIRIIMIFENENLLLLKALQNNVASNIAITEKNKASQTYHVYKEHYEIKLFYRWASGSMWCSSCKKYFIRWWWWWW